MQGRAQNTMGRRQRLKVHGVLPAANAAPGNGSNGSGGAH
jgi:hypothetical protein